MSKTLVFEGCPTCELGKRNLSGFGAIALGAEIQEYAMEALKGGVSGAGVVLAVDFVLPKLPVIGTIVPAAVRPVVGGLAALGLAFYLRKTNPSLANGIAIGGVAIASARILQNLLGKTLGLSGLGGDIDVLETSGYRGMEVTESAGLSATGALIAEEISDGMGTIIATEVGYGDDGEDEDW